MDSQTDHSPHTRLKQLTRSVHESLHTHAVLSRIFAADLSPREYTAILGSYYGFIAGVERQTEGIPGLAEFSLQPALSALSKDLQQLGQQADRLATCSSVQLFSTPAGLGALYVLYGSRAGGKMMAKRVASTLPNAPVAYFASGHDIQLWHNLLTRINAYDALAEPFAQLAESACNCFNAFGDWMTVNARVSETTEYQLA